MPLSSPWCANSSSACCVEQCAEPFKYQSSASDSPCLQPRGAADELDLLVLVPSSLNARSAGRHQELREVWARWDAPRCAVRFLFTVAGAERSGVDADDPHVLNLAASQHDRQVPSWPLQQA